MDRLELITVERVNINNTLVRGTITGVDLDSVLNEIIKDHGFKLVNYKGQVFLQLPKNNKYNHGSEYLANLLSDKLGSKVEYNRLFVL